MTVKEKAYGARGDKYESTFSTQVNLPRSIRARWTMLRVAAKAEAKTHRATIGKFRARKRKDYSNGCPPVYRIPAPKERLSESVIGVSMEHIGAGLQLFITEDIMTRQELLDRKEDLEIKLLELDWRYQDVKPILTELEAVNDKLEATEFDEIPF